MNGWDPEDPPENDNSRASWLLAGGIIAMAICTVVIQIGAFIAEAIWGG